jgi:hypothetical protein
MYFRLKYVITKYQFDETTNKKVFRQLELDTHFLTSDEEGIKIKNINTKTKLFFLLYQQISGKAVKQIW